MSKHFRPWNIDQTLLLPPNVRDLSACTILVGYLPRRNICVMPNAYLGFHWATTAFHTQELWNAYPPDIRLWISQHGGLTNQMIWLQAPSIYRYFRRC